MEFVIRSDIVIQLRESSVIRFQDPRLCSSDQLHLNDRPLVNRDGFFVASHPCPDVLTGGYNVRLYDRRSGHGVCDAFEGTTRVEAQCSSEDQGLVFRFRFPQCVPEGLGMSTEQRTFCIASWTDDENTYCVVRHSSAQRAWCLRYHTLSATTRTFVAYLFTGLRCNRDPVPVGRIGCIVLDMRLDLSTPKVQRSLCADDYEACMWENPCKDYWPDMQLACPLRCGVCNDTLPRLCTMPSWIRGKWVQTDFNETLEVGEDELTLSSLGDRYQCVDWQGGSQANEARGRHGAHSADVMLVKTFSNGCRHRYVCAQWRLVHQSLSFLLKYRLSRTQVWPFDGAAPSGPIGCHLFQYGDDNVQPFLDRYSSRHFKTLVQADTAAVDCGFPSVFGDEVTVTFRHSVRCRGQLRALDDRGVVKMRLVVLACPGGGHVRQFACVGRTSHSDEQFIVTYLEQTSEYHCWIFSPSFPTDFYLLSVSDCAAEAYGKIRSGLLQPVMSFHSGPSKIQTNTSIQKEIDSVYVYGTTSSNWTATTASIHDSVTRTTAKMLLSSADENYKSVKANWWEASAARTEVEKVTENIGMASKSTPAALLNDEYHNNRNNTSKICNVGNVADEIGNITDEAGNTAEDVANCEDEIGNFPDDVGNSTDNRSRKADNLETDDTENKRKKDEAVNNADYRRGERSQSEFHNGMNANETNDTSVEGDNITKETEFDRSTTETKFDQLDYGDLELIGRTEQTSASADIEAFPRLNNWRNGADESSDIRKLSNRLKDVGHSSNDDDDGDDREGSSYQQTDDKDADDDDMTIDVMTTVFHQNDDIEVIDDSNQLSTSSLSENITEAEDENVTSEFNQINNIVGNSTNDVRLASTTIVSLKPMAITSSAINKTSRDRLLFKAISLLYAFFSWNLATTVFA